MPQSTSPLDNPFSKEAQERLKYWTHRGKVIGLGANILATSANAESVSTREAFYAGAAFVFDLIVHIISNNDEPSNEDLLMMSRIADELEASDQRLRQVLTSAVPQQGKPS